MKKGKAYLWVVEVLDAHKLELGWEPLHSTVSPTRREAREIQQNKEKEGTPNLRFRIRKYVREE